MIRPCSFQAWTLTHYSFRALGPTPVNGNPKAVIEDLDTGEADYARRSWLLAAVECTFRFQNLMSGLEGFETCRDAAIYRCVE